MIPQLPDFCIEKIATYLDGKDIHSFASVNTYIRQLLLSHPLIFSTIVADIRDASSLRSFALFVQRRRHVIRNIHITLRGTVASWLHRSSLLESILCSVPHLEKVEISIPDDYWSPDSIPFLLNSVQQMHISTYRYFSDTPLYLPKLKVLTLSSTSDNGTSHCRFSDGCTALQTLVLNNFNKFITPTLSLIPNLRMLVLDNTDFSIHRPKIPNLPSLRILSMQHCRLSEVPDFSTVPLLQELHMAHNNLSEDAACNIHNIGSLQELQLLDISYNTFTKLDILPYIKSLRKLCAEHNFMDDSYINTICKELGLETWSTDDISRETNDTTCVMWTNPLFIDNMHLQIV